MEVEFLKNQSRQKFLERFLIWFDKTQGTLWCLKLGNLKSEVAVTQNSE